MAREFSTVTKKGTDEARQWAEHMAQMREQKHQEKVEQARNALGNDAPPDAIEKFIKEANRAQRQANAATREAKRQQKIAQQNLMAASGAAQSPASAAYQPPSAAPRGYDVPPKPMFDAPQSKSDELYDHPIFGSFAQPDGVSTVAIYRLPSDLPEHRGVTPGYLQSMNFDEFSEDAVRINHGGGKYRAVAKDTRQRVIRQGDFNISGRAKLYTPSEDDVQKPAQSRIAGFRNPDDDVPPQYRSYMEQQDRRMERLEALIEANLTAGQSKPASDEDKLDKWKRELEAKEEAEQKRHDRRMAELKQEMIAKAQEEAMRLQAIQAQAAAQSAQQADLLKAIMTSQGAMNQTLMTAVLGKPSEGSGVEKFMLPMMQGMGEMMKVQNSNFGQMFSILKDSMGGEDNRTTGSRVLDMIEKGVGAVGDKVGDQFPLLLQYLMGRLGGPKQDAVPQMIPAGSAYRLPDGRVVPPEVCAAFIARYQQIHKVNPSAEVCVAAFTDILNQQGQQQPAPQQIGQQAPMQQAPPQITQEQAEEFIRVNQQKAAEDATRAGKTQEEVQAIVAETGRRAVAHLRSLMNPQPAVAPQQPVVATPAPQVPAAAPQPGAAAVAAAQAAGGPVQAVTQAPATIPAAPAFQNVTPADAAPPQQPVTTAIPEAPRPTVQTPQPAISGPIPPPAGVATMIVEAGPVPPSSSIMVPWMHRGFLQFAVDAFQARQHPVEFLFLALQQGKISQDAKIMIGRIYEDTDENVPLKDVLTKVVMMLSGRGVVLPPEAIPVFQGSPEGESWIESFLFATTCDSKEEAIRKLKEE